MTSIVEHPAVEQQCIWLEKHGFEVARISVDTRGLLRLSELRGALRSDTAVVSAMLANNETGTIMPIAEVAAAAHAQGAIVHSNGALSGRQNPSARQQARNRPPLPRRSQAVRPERGRSLYVREGTPLRPLLLGAGHEHGLRPGTENVAAIVGLGKASRACTPGSRRGSCPLAGAARSSLGACAGWHPGDAAERHPLKRLPNTLNVSFPCVLGNALLAATPGVAASTGSACHEGDESPSGVLLAMGLTSVRAVGAVRFSVGRGTTEHQVNIAAEALLRTHRELMGSAGRSAAAR